MILPLWIVWALWIGQQIREPVRPCVWSVSPNSPAATGTWDAVRQKFYPPYADPMVRCFQRTK